jgi:hypothetical protein
MQPRAAGSRSSRSRSESAPCERRPRTGLRTGSFEARKPGRLCSASPSGRSLPERYHRRSRGDSLARSLHVGEPTAPPIDGSSDPPRGGVGGFETLKAPQRTNLIKGNPFGGSWDRATLCSRRFDQPGPHDRRLLREKPAAGSGGTSADHHLVPIRRADHRKPHLLAPERRITRRNDTALFQGIAGTTSGETNDRRASSTERCAAAREGNALKGATPRAPPARNKAGRVRGGVQGTKR